jgi:NAD(P)-dependent dehydrogenase (short-subunit alcohol dehydrogenase family)
LGGSKAAANFFFLKMAIDLKEDGVITLALDPGLVRDTNKEARLKAQGKTVPTPPRRPGMPDRVDIDIAISGLIAVTDAATIDDSGKVLKYTGEQLDW